MVLLFFRYGFRIDELSGGRRSILERDQVDRPTMHSLSHAVVTL